MIEKADPLGSNLHTSQVQVWGSFLLRPLPASFLKELRILLPRTLQYPVGGSSLPKTCHRTDEQFPGTSAQWR